VRLTHAQPLVPGEKEGELLAQPVLSQTEAALEADAMGWGEGEVFGEFEALDEVALGLYTHQIKITSAPEHLCRYYLVRLAP
jgi:hypothetical protein